ncbi:MAG: hypothetical protein JSW06_02985 [Thermoplasmatales archaeon]|nr:MAG: hypothetical protein JSW06_02985 [Thermoplasmatales archaeon]
MKKYCNECKNHIIEDEEINCNLIYILKQELPEKRNYKGEYQKDYSEIDEVLGKLDERSPEIEGRHFLERSVKRCRLNRFFSCDYYESILNKEEREKKKGFLSIFTKNHLEGALSNE